MEPQRVKKDNHVNRMRVRSWRDALEDHLSQCVHVLANDANDARGKRSTQKWCHRVCCDVLTWDTGEGGAGRRS